MAYETICAEMPCEQAVELYRRRVKVNGCFNEGWPSSCYNHAAREKTERQDTSSCRSEVRIFSCCGTRMLSMDTCKMRLSA